MGPRRIDIMMLRRQHHDVRRQAIQGSRQRMPEAGPGATLAGSRVILLDATEAVGIVT
jgi:hypothetical protein